MINNSEDSAAAKAFLYCPIPVLDVVAGLVVLGITEAAKSGSDSLKDAIHDGVKDGVKEGFSGVFALAEDSLRKQLLPVVVGMESLAGAVHLMTKTQEVSPTKEKTI